jgi:hypothetical protein
MDNSREESRKAMRSGMSSAPQRSEKAGAERHPSTCDKTWCKLNYRHFATDPATRPRAQRASADPVYLMPWAGPATA